MPYITFKDWDPDVPDGQQDEAEEVFTTVERTAFYEHLQRGDILLFESLDDLAVLGQSLERRPVYHSSLYVGPVDGRHTILHNVSYLWWNHHLELVPHRSEQVDGWGPVQHWMPGTADEDLERWVPTSTAGRTLEERRASMITALRKRGGVGPMAIDAYLDLDEVEHLWHNPNWPQRLRKIRSIVALRHPGFLPIPEDWNRIMKQTSTDINGVGANGGFPARELAALVPTLGLRPGFGLMVPGQMLPAAAVPSIHYHPTEGHRFICAMFCSAVYDALLKEWHMDPLELGRVPLFYDPDRLYHTPRDLWDCQQLTPVAMLVMPPDRGEYFDPPSLSAEDLRLPPSEPSPEPEPAVSDLAVDEDTLRGGYATLAALNAAIIDATFPPNPPATDNAQFLR